MNVAKYIPPVSKWTPFCSEDLQRAASHSKFIFIAPKGFLMTEDLSAALQEQGKTPVWLHLDTLDCDPGSCLLGIAHAAQRVNPDFGKKLILEMQRQPGPIFGWSYLFVRAAEEFEQNIPPNTALVIDGMQVLSARNPALIRQISTFLNHLPLEVSRYIISQEDLAPELMLDWDNACLKISMTINPEICREAAKESGIQVSNRCLHRAIRLSGGSPKILLGILETCKSLGPTFVENLVEQSSTIDLLLQKIARGWLSCATPEELFACCLTLENEYYHPEIGQAVCGHWKSNSVPWLQPLQDDWFRLRSVWHLPLECTLRINVPAKREILLLAADYLVKKGAPGLAMTTFLRLHEFQRAANLLVSLLDEMLNTGQWMNLKIWLNEIPEHILEDWPWLVYARGEIEAMEGDESRAYRSFSIAKNIFKRQQDNLGFAYTLLGESTLDARKRDLSRAYARAQQVHTLVNEYGIIEQQVWADYQLGILSANINQLTKASKFLSSAAANITDPKIAELIKEAQDQVQEYDHLIKMQKHHRQELKKVEDSLHAGAQKMKTIWDSRTKHLPTLLEKYGWLHTPLMHKLHAVDGNAEQIDGSGETPLIKRFLRKLGLHPNQRTEAVTLFPIVQDLPLPAHYQTSTPHQKTPTPSETINHTAPQNMIKHSKPGVPKITVYCLGAFRVYQDEKPVEEWFSGKGKAIFKYLVTHRQRPVAKEILMDIFWPDNDSDAARNNLNVAIYSLRQALRLPHPSHSYSHVIFLDECYMLNPEIDLWLDSKVFMEQIELAKSLEHAGELASAIKMYNTAEALYLGEFMDEDRYEDWPITPRQHLSEEYMKLLNRLSKYYFDQASLNACTTACRKMLKVDPCKEEAHRLLMQCFHLQGQPYLALRQYHECVDALKTELQVPPSAATNELYEKIRLQQYG